MLNALQINTKNIPYRPFDRAIDETLKIPEKCWPLLYLNFTKESVIFYREGGSRKLWGIRYFFSDQKGDQKIFSN